MPRSPTTFSDEVGIALGNLAEAARAPLTLRKRHETWAGTALLVQSRPSTIPHLP